MGKFVYQDKIIKGAMQKKNRSPRTKHSSYPGLLHHFLQLLNPYLEKKLSGKMVL